VTCECICPDPTKPTFIDHSGVYCQCSCHRDSAAITLLRELEPLLIDYGAACEPGTPNAKKIEEILPKLYEMIK